jgi:hypothetical protein
VGVLGLRGNLDAFQERPTLLWIFQIGTCRRQGWVTDCAKNVGQVLRLVNANSAPNFDSSKEARQCYFDQTLKDTKKGGLVHGWLERDSEVQGLR